VLFFTIDLFVKNKFKPCIIVKTFTAKGYLLAEKPATNKSNTTKKNTRDATNEKVDPTVEI
jgi:hypothetical protein